MSSQHMHSQTAKPSSSAGRAASDPARWLNPAQLAQDLALADLSDPADGPHAMQQVVQLAVAALTRAWNAPGGRTCLVRWCRGSPIVSVADNYDALGYDHADVTRDARYTRYLDETSMLRSHSTAMVPSALRQLAREPVDDVLLVCPGITYRRDAIDWQHTGTPHQLDLWRISRRSLGERDLDEMITILLAALVPGRPSRQLDRRHPYTQRGRQLDVARGSHGDWVEVWECGLAHPDVLAKAGLPDSTGLALGMGLDRLLMLRKQIPDIRLLRSADPRVLAQMRDLAPYRPVSSQPAIRRDLSIAVDAEDDAETVGDRVREILGQDAEAVEEVTIVSSTACSDLPQAAVARLGARPDQRNLLVRVVLRRLDRSISDGEANELRDRIYAALHAGDRHQWARSGTR